jgi:hypothetical protein
MSVYEECEHVNDKNSFLVFLRSLAKDYAEHPDEWENRTITDYLESISAWVEDIGEEPEHADFKKMAKLFYVGKIYE